MDWFATWFKNWKLHKEICHTVRFCTSACIYTQTHTHRCRIHQSTDIEKCKHSLQSGQETGKNHSLLGEIFIPFLVGSQSCSHRTGQKMHFIFHKIFQKMSHIELLQFVLKHQKPEYHQNYLVFANINLKVFSCPQIPEKFGWKTNIVSQNSLYSQSRNGGVGGKEREEWDESHDGTKTNTN